MKLPVVVFSLIVIGACVWELGWMSEPVRTTSFSEQDLAHGLQEQDPAGQSLSRAFQEVVAQGKGPASPPTAAASASRVLSPAMADTARFIAGLSAEHERAAEEIEARLDNMPSTSAEEKLALLAALRAIELPHATVNRIVAKELSVSRTKDLGSGGDRETYFNFALAMYGDSAPSGGDAALGLAKLAAEQTDAHLRAIYLTHVFNRFPAYRPIVVQIVGEASLQVLGPVQDPDRLPAAGSAGPGGHDDQ